MWKYSPERWTDVRGDKEEEKKQKKSVLGHAADATVDAAIGRRGTTAGLPRASQHSTLQHTHRASHHASRTTTHTKQHTPYNRPSFTSLSHLDHDVVVVPVANAHHKGRHTVPGAGSNEFIDGDGLTMRVRVIVLDPLGEGVALERPRSTCGRHGDTERKHLY